MTEDTVSSYAKAVDEILAGPVTLPKSVTIRQVNERQKFIFIDDVMLPFHNPVEEVGEDALADEYFQRLEVAPAIGATIPPLEIWYIPIYVSGPRSE